jgi:hypothetical protein
MIDFTRAFESAWERMHVILFRPFDFGKWCAIGLGAFLAGFLQGGNGFNSFPNGNGFDANRFNPSPATTGNLPKLDIQQFNSTLSHWLATMQVGLIVLFSILFFVAIFAFILLLYWLGARGQFMFLDNVVRNRGAIVWPWSYYGRQANSLFLFFLLLFVVTVAVMIVLVGGAALVGVPLLIHKEWPSGGQIALFVIFGILYILFCTGFGFITFIFRELGVPLMFRNGLMARAAFVESLNLVARYPGSIVLFVLLRIAIFIAVIVLSLIICCATVPCCFLGQWPYVGTVLLLPVLVYVKCFTLDCLAQFGPEYDVWTVDVPQPLPGGFSPLPPPV